MDLDDNEGADAFELYISSPPIPTVSCPVTYWYALEQTGDPLAQMALHFLTCPGKFSLTVLLHFLMHIQATSTDVERAFSRGRLTVSRTRHNLSDETTRASTVLSSWYKQDYLIPSQKLIKALGSKQQRPNNGKSRAISEDINGQDTSDLEQNDEQNESEGEV